MMARWQSLAARFSRPGPTPDDHPAGLGTFAGVFTPTVLTILGAIMYLRLGWVVGNAGLLGAIIIILLAHLITVSTGLSVASIATNTRVGAGGAFAIISQSLGLEVGGSVGVPLFLAQSISVALYVLAFSEAWQRIFPTHPFVLVAILSFLVVFAIAYVSIQFATRIQFLILAVVALSLVSVFLASFPLAGRVGLTVTPVLWGSFGQRPFWATFAVFFPAVTGIMAGISLSGNLRDPRRSIPLGTMGAIGVTMAIYLALAIWLARAATSDELLNTSTIMVDKAFVGWFVLAGMLGATFSSALGSLVAAPRVMHALAVYRIVPYSRFFGQATAKGEPRPAMFATAVTGFVALLIALAGGGLDQVAEIITMFFLITYAMLNLVVLFEQTLSMVSFRPTFNIPRIVPFIGMSGCLFVMFLINPTFSLVASVLVLGVYGYLVRRNLQTLPSDVRSGLFTSLAEWAVKRSSQMPSANERTWKPMVLVPVSSTGELTGSYRFLWAMTSPQGGVQTLGIYPPGEMAPLKDLDLMTQAFLNDGIYAQATLLEESDFVDGVRAATQVLRRTFFRPNVLFLPLRPDSDLAQLQQLVDKTAAYNMGIVLLARHPVIELGREQFINVWVSNQGPDWKLDLRHSNLDLAILLAYQLAQNWRGQINLCMAVSDAATETRAKAYLIELKTMARMPGNTQVLVWQANFEAALALAPRADLSSFGLPRNPDLLFCQRIVSLVDGSCVFIRDSGDESALA